MSPSMLLKKGAMLDCLIRRNMKENLFITRNGTNKSPLENLEEYYNVHR